MEKALEEKQVKRGGSERWQLFVSTSVGKQHSVHSKKVNDAFTKATQSMIKTEEAVAIQQASGPLAGQVLVENDPEYMLCDSHLKVGLRRRLRVNNPGGGPGVCKLQRGEWSNMREDAWA